LRFKSHAVVQGRPELKLRAEAGPLAFKAGAEGSVKASLGPIDATVGEIPLLLAIPFLRSGGSLRKVGAIGAFGVRIEPFQVAAEGFGVRFDGVLGSEGMACDLHGTMACKLEMDVVGTLPGKVAKASLELVDGMDVDETEEGGA
jgi:hypothetical protein